MLSTPSRLLQDFYINDVFDEVSPNLSTPRNSGFGKSSDDQGRLLAKTKQLKSKRLLGSLGTTCYLSIFQIFGGWRGRNSDVNHIPK